MADAIPSRGALVVGLISGTSMDGVDAALVRLGRRGSTPLTALTPRLRSGSLSVVEGSGQSKGGGSKPEVRLLAFSTTPYPRALQRRLLEIAGGERVPAGDISQLNFLLGEVFAAAALDVCRRARVSPRRLAAIGSHGQTLYHQGRATSRVRGIDRGVSSTLQIGEPAVIAERTGAPVVADFRTADLAAGGQGAPLVPLVDYLLLRHPAQGTVALNIGGISNVTIIPAAARAREVFGFDTGPGNMVMDALARRFTGTSFDRGGRLASRGRVIQDLLAGALRLPFFRQAPPKSAGREQFGREFLRRYFLRRRGAAVEDLLRTACELTAQTVGDALRRFVFPRVRVNRLIVSGGGAHHCLLMERLAELLPQLSVERSDLHGLPADAKEAIAFAVLADRTMRGLPGNLPAVTGARRAVVLGKVVWPGGRPAPEGPRPRATLRSH